MKLFSAVFLAAFSLSSCVLQAQDQSTAKLMTEQPAHLHAGSDITIRVKLNNPLPEGARFDMRLSPVLFNAQVSTDSGAPLNKERTEFLVKTKLPESALPGEWHIAVTYLFLPGVSWTSNTIATNDVHFTVEGNKVEIPTSGTATLLSDHR